MLGGGDGAVRGYNVSMLKQSERLSDSLERPVIDLTGLEGPFDLTIEHLSNDPHPDVVSWRLVWFEISGSSCKRTRVL
jgi:uncharacterized protein (TIGR03435 family)